MSKRTKASVKVVMTVLVDVGDSWGSDCSVGQAQKQGRETAERILSNLVRLDETGRVRIIGHKAIEVSIVEGEQ